MRGGPANSAGLPAEEYRLYRLAKTFGWTPTQIDEQPAITLDWLLAIDNLHTQIERDNG